VLITACKSWHVLKRCSPAPGLCKVLTSTQVQEGEKELQAQTCDGVFYNNLGFLNGDAVTAVAWMAAFLAQLEG
jgi:hypothetical protein